MLNSVKMQKAELSKVWVHCIILVLINSASGGGTRLGKKIYTIFQSGEVFRISGPTFGKTMSNFTALLNPLFYWCCIHPGVRL
uniref:Uncharacterized protein n=1 Tax=Anguilla anguilla TaxID=7936 RepID=A0A0E9XK67_ANGAN